MIKFYLMGGFGNLLFQKLFAMEFVKHFKLEIDESLISQNFITTRILGWKVHDNYSRILFDTAINTYDKSKTLAIVDLTLLFLSKKFRRMFFGRLWVTDTVSIESGCKVLAGYCQDSELFKMCSGNLPTLSSLITSYFPHEQRGFVIHYRGTDSVWAKGNDRFYDIVMSRWNLNEEITVVTDDINRAKQTFGQKYTFVTGSLLSDFSLMISAHHLVVAPSTLSWWAAVLSRNAKVIIMPGLLREKLPDMSDDARIRYV